MMSVLLVEDCAVACGVLARMVRRVPGLAVCGQATTATAALAILRNAPPDLVLLDLQLAESSGRAVLQALATGHPRTQVFVVTNHVDFIIRRRCLEEGAHGFYDKSHDLNRLQDDLRRFAGAHAGHVIAT